MTLTRHRSSTSVLDDIQATDGAVYRAIAASPTPTLDRSLRRLSHAADHSVLWLGTAAGLACVPGRPRRAALRGVVGVAVASTAVNVLAKTVFPRGRPDRLGAAVPVARHVRMPMSPSFPSGHSASAFAFASAVGAELPWISLPLHLLAATVAYSRVHTGVHYPLDTVVGASVGVACAAVVTRALAGKDRAER